ncbi:MAG: type I DNA topoisomerase [Bacteroidetes bacterium]|nr:type I DNA topoisomerase [Bacteroidota bacterium]
MFKNLIIVESPAKAKTIEGYLGNQFKVVSSYGHIRDLPKNNKAIDIQNGFEPTYIISKDKTDVVNNLKALSHKFDLIYLASDDDREGESIAWHLKEALQLEIDNTKRIVFREITKKAITNAIENPRNIDMDLVNSQQTRRILDRLVGFELSPILWSKIKTGLSAGRVQSVAVRMIVEREREILSFKSKNSFKVRATFDLDNNKILESELEEKLKSEIESKEFLEKCKDANFEIKNIDKKPAKKSSSAPFTTSTLQQEASQKLGFSVSQTMVLAQKLYEEGKISYMRTDSVNLSDEAISKAKDEIINSYGNEYLNIKKYKTKSDTAQEAHEAIRPTDFSKKEVSEDFNSQRLYNLIWRRAIASQMSDAKLEKTIVEIKNDKSDYRFIAKGEVIKFKGFLEVYSSSDEDSELSKMLPPLNIGQKLKLDNIIARQRFTKPPARFAEAALVKQLEERGIGRPSTYAPTISTIQKRGYVIKESREGIERKYISLILKDKEIKRDENKEITGAEKNKLFPTDIAMIVNDFLVEHFPNITDYGFTALMETKLDQIAHDHKPWREIISKFYKVFKGQVDRTGAIERTDVKTSRELGIDPKTSKKVIARVGRYGPIVQIGQNNEETGEKARFAPLRKGQLIETITLEEALELFKLPREVGVFEKSTMIANIGRFGPYIKHENKFYSIPKDFDPFTIDEANSIQIIKDKREAEKKKIIKFFDEAPEIQVLNGRFGPYIKADKKNIKIPKDLDASKLTLDKCKEIIKNAPEKKTRKKSNK